ncbi:MAG: cyclic nucleotide-binding domain-containing protein [Candidatus Brocadiae bacterium]|nr:cyclic nucleotide-binding domain-containing protein [Candidatus Brocadiia bacterium]
MEIETKRQDRNTDFLTKKLLIEKYVSLDQMQKFINIEELQNLVDLYFSNPSKTTIIKENEILMQKGQPSDRLYFVHSGKLRCEIDNFDGTKLELFIAYPNSFLGLYSFFSKTFISSATVYALEDSKISYIDKQCLECRQMNSELFKQFMPYVVNAFHQRGIKLQKTVLEREHAIQKLVDNEKYTCLGEMAAGIAHELNNAIAVLERNTKWISENLPQILDCQKEDATFSKELGYYQLGLTSGRSVSNKEIRKRLSDLEKKGFSDESAEILANIGISDQDLPSKKASLEEIHRLGTYWETGATCHDMLIAAKQAAHVVKSVRELARRSQNKTWQNVNESIEEALILLHSSLRQISVYLDLQNKEKIFVNKGDLVQIWTNIIKNAYESLMQSKTSQSEIKIGTISRENHILISIQDNGPGIPPDLMSKLFQPHITTKFHSQSSGLGLGLTIIHRLVSGYGGSIKVESEPGKTIFTVIFPVGEENELEYSLH